MRRILLAVFCIPFVVLFAPAVHANEKPADAPAVVVRAKSLNALLENMNFVVRLIGQEDAAAQIEGLVKGKIGKDGIQGIDPGRPFGAYVHFGKGIGDVKGAILIPMADDKSFLNLLDSLGVKYAKDKDGIYTHKTNNVDLYFRFSHDYLYITSLNTESIQTKNLSEPAKALALSGDAMFAVVARMDQIPNEVKSIALGQLEEKIDAAKKTAATMGNKAQEEFLIALLTDSHQLGKSLIREAVEIRFDLDVTEKTKEMTVNFNVTAKPGSDLAKSIKSMGNLKSPLAGLVKDNVAFQGGVHLVLPAALQTALGSLFDDVKENGLKGIQTKEKRDQAQQLFDAMMPSAKAGEFQFVAAVVGPQMKRYTFVAALKLKEGDKLAKTAYDLLKEAIAEIPAEKRDKFKLDFDSVGPIKIHKFEIPKDGKIDAFLDDVAGDNQLYVAFRDDALFLAIGKEALPTLKAALANKDAVPSQPFVFDFDVARMALLMAQNDEQKKLAAKLFPPGEKGQIRLAIDGGTSLSARLQLRLNVLEFLVKLKNDQTK
jgi:hypothetical protein